jgi:F-box protein 18 (helicase)
MPMSSSFSGSGRLAGALAGLKNPQAHDATMPKRATTTPMRIDGRELGPEQLAALGSGARLLKIQAFAGAGKTTLLRGFATQAPKAKALYLAFNRAIADHARSIFPEHVECRTHNGAALRALGSRDSAWRGTPSEKFGDVSKEHLAALPGMDRVDLDMALGTLARFIHSAAVEIDEGHFPLEEALFFGAGDMECDPGLCLDAARRAWKAMSDPGHPMPMPHDGYLKLWSLSPGQLPYDFIMVDESQDSNAAFLAGMSAQRCRQIFVGDEHQGIYGFRGAINALSELRGFEERQLTLTHRFGANTACLANAVIESKGKRGAIRPSPFADDTQVVFGRAPLGCKALHLARTNAGLFDKALELARHGKAFSVVGGSAGKLAFPDLPDLLALGAGRSEGAYKAYRDLDALREQALAKNRPDLALRAKLAKTHGDQLPSMLNAIARKALPLGDPQRASAPTLSTLHQAKGLESDWVELLGDFAPPLELRDDRPASFEQLEEANVLYVAITRARKGLAIGPGPVGDWAQSQLAGLQKSPEEEVDLFGSSS